MALASSSSRVLFAVLALSIFAATATTTAALSSPSPHAATATSGPSPHATTATATSGPSAYAATATTSSCPSAYAATATTSSCPSPYTATATASARPSPQGHPPAEETMEEAPSTPEEEGGGDEKQEEHHLLHDLQELMREAAASESNAERLEHLDNVLQLLGFREMAALVPSLVSSPVIAAWPGPLTVFAVPDEVLQQATCPDCWMGGILAEHIGLGSFSYANLSSKPQMKVAAAMVGFCFTASASSSVDGASNVTVSIDGVKVTRPDLYIDPRLVIHAVEGLVTLAPGSCFSTRLLSKLDMLRLMVRLFRL